MLSTTNKIIFPLSEYRVDGLGFGENATAGKILGVHLGEDAKALVGTRVRCIGNGKVVYSALHPGNVMKGNWGYIVIVRHKDPTNKIEFYSLYGHLSKPGVKKDDEIKVGQLIGLIGPSNTAENGWWPAHLHFAIYTGPWTGKVLPGYLSGNSNRTKLEFWKNPSEFISNYQKIFHKNKKTY